MLCSSHWPLRDTRPLLITLSLSLSLSLLLYVIKTHQMPLPWLLKVLNDLSIFPAHISCLFNDLKDN